MEWIKQHLLLVLICTYFLIINLITFIQYGWDKRQARKQKSRIPEKRLHLLALLGGTIGALAGQRKFRHKTQKVRFQAVFIATAILQLALIGFLIYLKIRG